ncbi:hypothetical protein [Stenotrophomonas sp. S39]|uniref:hypothetical protein n=1 Tax=Stenotrophomonas sp. S39 TaxID=2767451 RepID=UPI00190C9C72|nr:hypothetical protein [Stenotrophomonas sp. S39]MBK0055100.1 hypothetical protein [Stenotrophomonas sp. S39]
MPRLTVWLALALALAATPFAASCQEAPPGIELHASCIDNAPCHFLGEDIRVELELRNVGSEDVQVPAEFYRRRGPSVKLLDRQSGKETSLASNPPDARLLKSLQTLRPGQSFRFPWRILPTEISRFAPRPIDVSAVFSVNLTPGARGGRAHIASSELRITDPAGSAQASLMAVPGGATAGEPAGSIVLTARCIDNPTCRFTGEEIVVELELRNEGQQSVQLPISYLHRMGPRAQVTDNQSGASTWLRTPRPDRSLVHALVPLAPGESIRMTRSIMPHVLQAFAQHPVDASVEFSLNLAPQNPRKEGHHVKRRIRITQQPQR